MSLDDIIKSLKIEIPDLQKVILIGIGNELNGDDGVGPYVADALADAVDFTVFNSGTQPDNFTGKIMQLNPSHVIFVDAATIEGEPGAITAVPLDDIDELCVHTHYMPLKHVVRRLTDKCDCKFLVIGIRPASMEIGDGLSTTVRRTADELIKKLKELDARTATE